MSLRATSILVLALLTGPASLPAQTPPPGMKLPPQAALPATVPAEPETLVADLVWPAGSPAPLTVNVFPDTLVFGSPALIVVAGPAGTELPVLEPEPDQEWLAVADPADPAAQTLLRSFAEAAGQEEVVEAGVALLPIRAYTVDAFRVRAGGVLSAPVTMTGRAEGTQRTAAIRDPRPHGWNLLFLGLVVLVAVLLVWLIWAVWRRRRSGGSDLEDWAVREPGWLAAASALQDLLEAGLLERGDSRGFLDRLTRITRVFVAERYGVSAREMTGPEILQACRERGFVLDIPRRFVRLIDGADRRRYDPEGPEGGWCRAQTAELLAGIEAVRITPGPTPVAARTLLTAETAWAGLQAVTGPVPSAAEGRR